MHTRIFALLLTLSCTFSCAELRFSDSAGQTPGDVTDGDGDAPDAEQDGDAGGDSDDGSDADAVDGIDGSDDGDDGDSTSFCPGDATPCEAGEKRCTPDGRSLQSCNAVCLAYLDGSATRCPTGQLCYATGTTASCAEPAFDECDPLSDNGDVCVGAERYAPCKRDGSLGEPTECAQNARCANGKCRTPIVETGASCANRSDCNDFCLCGSDYSPRVPGECDHAPIRAGFCTVDDCVRDGCLAGDVCASLKQTSFAGSSDVCLPTAPCDGKLPGDVCVVGGRTGFVCREVPVADAAGSGISSWTLACYDGVPISVGAPCSTSGQCLGGACKRRATNSVCSQACTTDEQCPGASVCVYNPDSIDVTDPSTQQGIDAGLCLHRSTECEGDDGINPSLQLRKTRTFAGSQSLISVCYLQE